MRHFVISLDRPDHDKLQWFFGSCSTFSHLRVTPGFLYWTTRNSNVMCTLGESLESRQWLYSVAPKDTLFMFEEPELHPGKCWKWLLDLVVIRSRRFLLKVRWMKAIKKEGMRRKWKKKKTELASPFFMFPRSDEVSVASLAQSVTPVRVGRVGFPLRKHVCMGWNHCSRKHFSRWWSRPIFRAKEVFKKRPLSAGM